MRSKTARGWCRWTCPRRYVGRGWCISLTQIAGEGLFTEGAYLLVEGVYTVEERLRVSALGHPPSESRDQALTHCGHVDFTGAGAVPPKHRVRGDWEAG